MNQQKSIRFLDENENDEDRNVIEQDIKALMDDINTVKQDMFKVYNDNKESLLFESLNLSNYNKPNKKMSNTICVPGRFSKKTIPRKEQLAIFFYQKFLFVKSNNNKSIIRFLFTKYYKQMYGLCFIQKSVDSYILHKCFLPCTFNMTEERNKYPLKYYEIPDYIHIVQENINAYSLRAKQVEEFKKVADKKILLNHTDCFTEIEMKFKVINLDTNIRKCAKVQLIYPILYIYPTIINIEVNGDDHIQKLLEENFTLFTEKPLNEAYKLAFVNTDNLKFYI